MQKIVVAQNLRKDFGSKTAVASVSFDVRAGEVFGLLGPNGAGKTTTIRMLLNIFQPDAGTISVLGGSLTRERSDRIGYMPEERGLYPNMRVLNCLVYLGTLKGMRRKEARERAEHYLDRLGLADQAKTKIDALSRGMTQKVQVIAAVLHDPDLLIIDEPFANLDPINAQLVREIILEMRDAGKAVIMTSHLMSLVETLCDRIALIHHGEVVLLGTVADVRRQFARNVVRISGSGRFSDQLTGVTHVEQLTASEWQLFVEPDFPPRDVVAQLVQTAEFTLDRFEVDMPSLDEVFVQVVKGETDDLPMTITNGE